MSRFVKEKSIVRYVAAGHSLCRLTGAGKWLTPVRYDLASAHIFSRRRRVSGHDPFAVNRQTVSARHSLLCGPIVQLGAEQMDRSNRGHLMQRWPAAANVLTLLTVGKAGGPKTARSECVEGNRGLLVLETLQGSRFLAIHSRGRCCIFPRGIDKFLIAGEGGACSRIRHICRLLQNR